MAEKRALVGACGAIVVYIISRRRRRRRNRKLWIRPWIKNRPAQGAYENLLRELRLEDRCGYRNFIRMDPCSFDELLSLVAPRISKRDTICRLAIPAAERLTVTFRFLATGK